MIGRFLRSLYVGRSTEYLLFFDIASLWIKTMAVEGLEGGIRAPLSKRATVVGRVVDWDSRRTSELTRSQDILKSWLDA